MPRLNENSKATAKLLKEIGIDKGLIKNYRRDQRLHEVRAEIYDILEEERNPHYAWVTAWAKGLTYSRVCCPQGESEESRKISEESMEILTVYKERIQDVLCSGRKEKRRISRKK
jgi:hypothetical protein